MDPRFTPDPDLPGFVVADPIQNRQFPVTTDGPVELRDCDTDRFLFPVGSARSMTVGELVFPYVVIVVVRDADGRMLAEISHGDEERFGPGEYVLEAHAPMKLFVRLSGPFEVSGVNREIRISPDESSEVEFGARSHHEKPAGTVTIADSPDDLRRALPYMGSALKDTSPERSFPTLRGHPPLIEIGDEFSVPDGIEPPETGVTVEAPVEAESLLEVSPLVYYLGADLVPGPEPRLTTERGFEFDLGGESPYESVKQTLEQLFTLDCVVRTEGLYPVDLYERGKLEEHLDWDFAALYDSSLAEQVATYLSVPYETVADHTPTWPIVGNCKPFVDRAEYLPFVLNELGLVRCVTFDPVEPAPEMNARIDDFARDGPSSGSLRGAADEPDELGPADLIEVPPADAMEKVWFGDRWPLNAGKFVKAGFENKFRKTAEFGDVGPDSVKIVVVCNDGGMREEIEGEQLYGNREELPFEVQTHLDTTPGELREILGQQADFFHYIGHIEGSRFVCSGGELDVNDVDEVGARGFLLNGCKSMFQGQRMLETGSVAGIVTMRVVGNRGAVRIGREIARLLNIGHGMGMALNIAQRDHLIGSQYTAIGDTRIGIVQNEDSSPAFYTAFRDSDGGYRVRFITSPGGEKTMGMITTPREDFIDEYHITGGPVPGELRIPEADLSDFIASSTSPVLVEDQLRWDK